MPEVKKPEVKKPEVKMPEVKNANKNASGKNAIGKNAKDVLNHLFLHSLQAKWLFEGLSTVNSSVSILQS